MVAKKKKDVAEGASAAKAEGKPALKKLSKKKKGFSGKVKDKAAEKSDGKKKGVKRKAEDGEGGRARKGPRKSKNWIDKDDPEAKQKMKERSKDKKLNPRQARRKEITHLYSELINPGREREPTAVVEDILKQLAERTSPLAEYCAKDMGSRLIQACLKWGSHKHRRHLLTVLKADIPKLAIDRYGHVVVIKLLLYTSKTSTGRKPTDEEKKARSKNLRDLLEGFHGKNLHSAFFNKFGCRVINAFYFSEAVDAKEKRRLLHEVAVPATIGLTRPEMPGSRPLRQLMAAEDLTKEQRNSILTTIREAAERAVDKELLQIDIVQLLFQAFCEFASEEQLKDLAEKCMAGSPHLLSSKPGAEALLRLLGVANAKQRKEFLRELKGKFAALSMNAVDYIVMMRILSTVDDTVLLSKTMVTELLAELSELCFDKYGQRVLSWMFRPGDSHFFSPYEKTCLSLPAPSSLKAAETRRNELIRTLRPPLRTMLLESPLKFASDVQGKHVLVAYLAADWDAEIVDALVVSSKAELSKDDQGLLGNGTTTTTLLELLKVESEKSESSLAQALWKQCFSVSLVVAASSRCAFVLLAILKQQGTLRKDMVAALKKKHKELETSKRKIEADGQSVAGLTKLLEEVAKGGN